MQFGITTILTILALLIGARHILFAPEKPIATIDQHRQINLSPLEQLIESIKQGTDMKAVKETLAKSPIRDKVPNTIHVFEIRNATPIKINNPVYVFEAPGLICFLHITDAVNKDKLQADFAVDPEYNNMARLPMDSLQPGTFVRGYICSKVRDVMRPQPLKVIASADNVPSEDLIRSIVFGGTRESPNRWLYVGLAVVVIGLNAAWLLAIRRRKHIYRNVPVKAYCGYPEVLSAGQHFATRNAGTMYWYNVPTGWISEKGNFDIFLEPAINQSSRIKRVIFVLDKSKQTVKDNWAQNVLPLIAGAQGLSYDMQSAGEDGKCGRVEWVYRPMDGFTPPFKLAVDDTGTQTRCDAHIMVSFAPKDVAFTDGIEREVLAPDVILETERVEYLLDMLQRLVGNFA